MKPTSSRKTQAKTKLRFNFSHPLIWKDLGYIEAFNELSENPPIHSVVIKIYPIVAHDIVQKWNDRNRPLSVQSSKRIEHVIGKNYYGLTGDTIKFGKDGYLLDGQHRLAACDQSGKPITTHVVFGLPDDIFDILDDGKKRSAADALSIKGINFYTWVAAAIRWLSQYDDLKGGKFHRTVGLTNRDICQLADTKYQTLEKHFGPASLINKAFGHPPSLIMGISYAISRRSKGLAKEFFHEWAHGARIGRNAGFDALSRRLISLRHKSGGPIDPRMRAAMIIITFNHWQANEVPSPRALTWDTKKNFPKLIFDGKTSHQFDARRKKPGKK